MRLRADEHANTFRQRRFKLLVQLVDRNAVAKVEDVFLVALSNLRVAPVLLVDVAAENDANVECDEDVVVGGTSPHRELVSHVLLGDEELDLGPRETPDKAARMLDRIERAVLGDDRVRALRDVDVGRARMSLWDQHDRRIAV